MVRARRARLGLLTGVNSWPRSRALLIHQHRVEVPRHRWPVPVSIYIRLDLGSHSLGTRARAWPVPACSAAWLPCGQWNVAISTRRCCGACRCLVCLGQGATALCVHSAAHVGASSLGPHRAGRRRLRALLPPAVTCVMACGSVLWHRRWCVPSRLCCSGLSLGGRARWLRAMSGCCNRLQAVLGCVRVCGSLCVHWPSLPLIRAGGSCGRAGVSCRMAGPACASSLSWRRGAVCLCLLSPPPLWCGPPAWRSLICGAACVMLPRAHPWCPSPGHVGALGTPSLSWCLHLRGA